MKEFVTVIFDANGGGITVSSKRVVCGEPYGELPPPARFGYEFNGWFTAEEGGELIDSETVVTADSSHALYAHWTKNERSDEKLKAYKKKKASLKRQKVIIAVSAVLAILLIIGLCVVAYLVNRTNLEDVDGTVYKIIKKDGTYILCDANEKLLGMTEDGKYYVTAAGSQIKLDAATGEASIYAYVDTVGREVVGNVVTSRILAFPQVEKKEMTRLEIHNDHGGYAFIGTHKNGTDTYHIEGHKNTSYNQEQFASLIVSCGYVLAMSKIEDPIADENGEYSMYGLVAQTRTDDEGKEYSYTPAWYELTDTDGNTYRVIVGDKIVSGAGYYVQYINPDYRDQPFIYIVNSDIANTVLQPVEALVQPMIVYPMTLSTYFNVKNFTIMKKDTDNVISFSFIPLEERQGTVNTTVPYIFLTDEMKGFRPSSNNIDICLQGLCNMTFSGVIKLAPDDEAMITYGVADPETAVYYKFVVNEADYSGEIEHYLFISKMTERGTYYIYSQLSDMIVEVDRTNLAFLDFKPEDWIDDTAYSFNLACTTEIALASGSGSRVFSIDNSDTAQFTFAALTGASYTSTGYSGDKTSYHLVKNNGKYGVAVGSATGAAPEIYASGIGYLLTSENKLYLIADKSSTTLDLNSGKTGVCTVYLTSYDKTLDSVMYLFVDETTGTWGMVKRNLTSDAVRVKASVDGKPGTDVTTTYFRHFFQTILYASIEGECNLTDEEMAAFRAKPDSEAQLVMTVRTEGHDYVFRFYQYTERRSYITIDGVGTFYMLSDRVEKIWNDAGKIIAGEDVTATSKN